MWPPRLCILLILLVVAKSDGHEDEDPSSVFLEAVKSFFANKENINGLQGLAKAFLHSDGRKEVNGYFPLLFLLKFTRPSVVCMRSVCTRFY